jgi:hypothetical protein
MNIFFPIYQKLESELVDLSFYIAFTESNLQTYSIKIADLLLRTVSECENIMSAICKREGIQFRRSFVKFQEYLDKLNQIYMLNAKIVHFIYKNADVVNCISKTPFYQEEETLNRNITDWYNAYNKIKHDRVDNFEKANLKNLIEAMSGLFLLNIIHADEEFIETENRDFSKFVTKINSVSNVFKVLSLPIMPKRNILPIVGSIPKAKPVLEHYTFLVEPNKYIDAIYSEEMEKPDPGMWPETICTFYAKLNKANES